MGISTEMKYRHYHSLILAAFFTFWAVALLVSEPGAEELVLEYAFDRPSLEQIVIGEDRYDRIMMPGASNGGYPGHPALPVKGAYILIPFEEEVTTVKAIALDTIHLGTGYVLEPVDSPVPFSLNQKSQSRLRIDSSIYSRTTPYPDNIHKVIGVHRFRGYNILVIKLLPVKYIPSTGGLYYHSGIKIIVETGISQKGPQLYRGLAGDEAELVRKVDNPKVISSYPVAADKSAQNCDMIIITLPWLVQAFQPLKDYHNANGLTTEIYTFVDVLNEVGNDFPTDIREFIRQKYLNDGIQYVLIGDDNNILSTRYLYVEKGGYSPEDSAVVEYHMPADLYFGCLDGTFDSDGDSLYGEPHDGEEGGDIDLMAEVYVGRASVDDSLEAARFVEKTIRYLTSDDPYLRKVLMCGERTYFPGLMEFGKQSLVELVDGSDLHGYPTVGIPSGLYQVDWLCEMDGLWRPDSLIDRINSGLHVINHIGHNAYQVALKLSFSDLDPLFNEKLCLVYSQGCYSGGFDTLDCWAEYVTAKIDGGAFAAIMNARYGYGTINHSDSPSHRLNREFWDAVFNPAENKPQLGRANQDSKEDLIHRIDEPAMRWVAYGLNLFGDPAVSLTRLPGLAFDYPDGLPALTTLEQPFSFRVNVTGLYGGTQVPGSGMLHYSINGEPVQSTAMTELSPGLYDAILPPLQCGDTLSFSVSAEEIAGQRLYDPPPGSTHEAIPVLREITIFEDDFETDKGWVATDEYWQRGIPEGGGGECGWPDPVQGFNGPNIYGYNLEGDYANGLSPAHLTSPAIDCTFMRNVRLIFRRWLNVGHSPADSAAISVSTNGNDWITLWGNPGQMLDSTWMEMNLDISEFAAYQPTVHLRWTMGPTSPILRYSGWNIDDLRIVSYDCHGYYDGDSNGDRMVNVADAVYLINYVFKGGAAPDPVEAGDANCDKNTDVADAVYLINFVFKGGSRPCCL